jgi:transcriptional regulator with XRE-family HTH domain
MTGNDQEQLTGRRMHDYAQLLDVLARTREDQGITQADLARRVYVTQTTMSYWLTGKRKIAAPWLFLVAGALGYDLALIPRGDA